jgi:hypothetical protein
MITGLDNDMELPAPDSATEDAIRAAATEELMARRSAAACSPRRLAARIATRLFTNAFHEEGTRLEIKQATGPETERSLGGWCYAAALDHIAAILEENARAMAWGAPESLEK